MDVIFHRRIQHDMRAALSFYDSEGGSGLGDRFFAAAEDATVKVIANPQGFHFVSPTLRRLSLTTFPYHFLYEENPVMIRFMVLRHDKRHPSFGLRRK